MAAQKEIQNMQIINARQINMLNQQLQDIYAVNAAQAQMGAAIAANTASVARNAGDILEEIKNQRYS